MLGGESTQVHRQECAYTHTHTDKILKNNFCYIMLLHEQGTDGTQIPHGHLEATVQLQHRPLMPRPVPVQILTTWLLHLPV